MSSALAGRGVESMHGSAANQRRRVSQPSGAQVHGGRSRRPWGDSATTRSRRRTQPAETEERYSPVSACCTASAIVASSPPICWIDCAVPTFLESSTTAVIARAPFSSSDRSAHHTCNLSGFEDQVASESAGLSTCRPQRHRRPRRSFCTCPREPAARSTDVTHVHQLSRHALTLA